MVSRGTRTRRATVWQDTLVGVDMATGTQALISLAGDLLPTDTAGMTLVRTIMCYTMIASAPHAVSGWQSIDLGIGAASQEAFAAGIVPDPNTRDDQPQRGWVYRCRHEVLDELSGSALSIAPVIVNKDIRSMRKIENGELYLVINNSPVEGTTFNVRTRGIIRCLFKLQ